MHVQVLLNGIRVKAMVDSGATHNFVATSEASRLDLKLVDDDSRIKAVNSKAQRIQGIAKDVLLQVGEWKGKINLLCVPFDDFNLILGIDFFLKSKAALIPHLGGLMILEEKQPYFVPVVDPLFSLVCVPTRWARLAFCLCVGKPFKKTVWSCHLFLFYFKREKQNKKEKPLNVTPDKKRQV